MSKGLFPGAIASLVIALLVMASATTTLAQSPEIRKALRYYENEQPSKMLPALEQAVKSDPESSYYLGLGYILQGDLDKALSTFEKGIQDDDKNPLPVAGKGHVLLLQKKSAEAKALLTKAADMNRKKTAAQWEAIGRAYLADSKHLLDAIAAGQVGGHVASHAVTTVFYLVHRARGAARARSAVADLLSIVDVVALEQADFLRALAFELPDYEDAVQVAAGLRAGARFVVTRNPKDFMGAELPTRSAGEILALLAVAGP